MDIKTATKDKLMKKRKQIDELIAKKGIGSSYLEKAQRTQRNMNFAVALGGLAAVAGLTIWAVNRSK